MASDPDSGTTVIVWAIDHLWIPISGSIVGVWAHLQNKFNKLDEGKVDKDEFEMWSKHRDDQFSQFMNRSSMLDEQHRQTEIKLFDKIDQLKTIMLSRNRERRMEDE